MHYVVCHGVTVTANQLLNTFGSVRDLQYLNNTEGTGKDGTVYGSRDVGLTGSALLNYIENAIFDTNQVRYYSAEKGMSDALYSQRRTLTNLIQKLEDQGYTIPSSSDLNSATTSSRSGTSATSKVSIPSMADISRAARMTASTNSKGQEMINNAITERTNMAQTVSTNTGYSLTDTVKNALQAGGYIGIEGTGGRIIGPRQQAYAPRRDIYVKGNDKIVEFGTGTYIDREGNTHEVEGIYRGVWGKEKLTSDDNKIYRQFITTDGKEYFLNQEDSNLVPWHLSVSFEGDIDTYREVYERWKALPANERPATWYELYEFDSGYDPQVYNEMVSTNFDTEKLKRWFTSNSKKIVWKQTK